MIDRPVTATILVCTIIFALIWDNQRVWNNPESLTINMIIITLMVVILVFFAICIDYRKGK